LFEYSHEELNTGIASIDEIQTLNSVVMEDFQLLAENGDVFVFESGDGIVTEDYRVDSIRTTANNEFLQTESSSSGSLGDFLDFSEQNPFSEGSDW
jgi:Tol biopolymer transport system component